MAYYLNFPSGGVIDAPNDLIVTPSNTYVIKQNIRMHTAAAPDNKTFRRGDGGSGVNILLGPQSNSTYRLFVRRGSLIALYTRPLADYELINIEAILNFSNGDVELWLNGELQASGNFPDIIGQPIATPRIIGGETLTKDRYAHDLYSLQEYVDDVLVSDYQPSATPDPSLPVLIDTVGGNHGTLNNFTLPDAYVYYYDWLNEPADTPDYALKLTTASETLTLPLVGAYDVTVTYADDTTANYTGTDTLVLNGTTPVHIKHIKGTDSEGYVYFDGNNDANTTNLPELIQGKHGVLAGFPTPSGYVRDEQGVIEGYKFNGGDTYASIPVDTTKSNFGLRIRCKFLTTEQLQLYGYYASSARLQFGVSGGNLYLGVGNASYVSTTPVSLGVEVEYEIYKDSVTSEWVGVINGAEVIRTTAFTESPSYNFLIGARESGGANFSYAYQKVQTLLQEYDSDTLEVINNYDFTTGDADQIIDTVGGNHATIVNAPTSGYLPVVERRVFTIGDGKDYLNFTHFRQSEGGRLVHDNPFKVGIVSGLINDTLTQWTDWFLGGLLLKGQTELGGMLKQNGFIGATHRIGSDHGVIQDLYIRGRLEYKTENRTITFKHNIIENCFIYDDLASNGKVILGVLSVTENRPKIINSLIVQASPTNVWEMTAVQRLDIYNCVLIDANTNGNFGGGTQYIMYHNNCHLENCVLSSINGFRKAINTNQANITGNNNIGWDDTVVTHGMGTQIPNLADFFLDPANNKYNIKESYADLYLKGQGWNGSDIAGWAYYDDAATGVTTVTATYDVSFDVLQALSSNHDITLDFRETINNSYSAIFDIRALASNTYSVEFDFNGNVSTLYDVDIDFRESVSINQDINLNFRETVNYSKDIAFNLRERVSTFKDVAFNLREQVSAYKDITFDLLETVSNTLTNLYNIGFDLRETKTAPHDIAIDLRETVQQTQDVTFNFRELVSQTVDVTFNLFGLVTNTISTAFDFRETITQYHDISLTFFGDMDWNAPAHRITFTFNQTPVLLSFSNQRPII